MLAVELWGRCSWWQEAGKVTCGERGPERGSGRTEIGARSGWASDGLALPVGCEGSRCLARVCFDLRRGLPGSLVLVSSEKALD